MGVPITPLIDLANCIICVACGVQLYRTWSRDRSNMVLLYFAQGYTSLVFSYLFFSVPRLAAPENNLLLGIGFVLAQAFLYGGVAFFAKVPVYFVNRVWVKRIFLLVVAVSGVAVAMNILFFNRPVYDPVTSLTNWNIHPVVSILSTIIFSGVLLPSAVFFFLQGRRSRDHDVRRRSFGLTLGLALLIVTAYTYYAAQSPVIVYISDLLSLCSYLAIFWFVIYRRQSLPHEPSITNSLPI